MTTATLLLSNTYCWLPITAFLLTVAMMPAVKWLALRFEIVSIPAATVLDSSMHQRTVPLLGGAAIMIALLATLALAGDLPLWLAVGAFGLLAIGLVDDIKVLKPRHKLTGQIVIIVAVVILSRHPALTPWPLIDSLMVMVWLVATTNAYNLVDGLDGLAGGIGLLVCVAMAITGWLHGNFALVCWALVLAGGLAGFLVYNIHPASVFMGDSGALPIGLLLGVYALKGGGLAHNSHVTRYVFPITMLAMPLMDTAVVSVTRLATGNAISRRGLDHSHHRLMHLGLSTRTAVAICWMVAGIGAACAVAMSMLPHPYLIATLPMVTLVFAVCGLFMMDLTFDASAPGVAYGYLQGVARFILSLSYKRRLVEVVLDFSLISAAYFGAFLLRRNFSMTQAQFAPILRIMPWILIPTYVAFAAADVYRGMWRYAGLSELIRFANGAVLAGILIVVESLFVPLPLAGSVLVLYVLLLFNLLAGTRMSFRALRKGIHRLAHPRERVLIIGAGAPAAVAARYLFSGQNRNARLVGFLDDDAFKRGKLVHGHRVLGSLDDMEHICDAYPFDQIMIAVESLDDERLALIHQFADQRKITVSRFSIQIDELRAMRDSEMHSAVGGQRLRGGDPIAVTQPRALGS